MNKFPFIAFAWGIKMNARKIELSWFKQPAIQKLSEQKGF